MQIFSLEALSAKAEFITNKAEKDADTIAELKKSIENSQREINKYKSELITFRDELVHIEKEIVEITYLQYAGRNRFPNPFHQRIMTKLNGLLEIAIRDPEERAKFVQELARYTQEKTRN